MKHYMVDVIRIQERPRPQRLSPTSRTHLGIMMKNNKMSDVKTFARREVFRNSIMFPPGRAVIHETHGAQQTSGVWTVEQQAHLAAKNANFFCAKPCSRQRCDSHEFGAPRDGQDGGFFVVRFALFTLMIFSIAILLGQLPRCPCGI